MDIDVDLDLEMKISRRELLLLLSHEVHLGHKAASNIRGTMSKDVLSIRTAQYWFHRFKNGTLELDDLPHTGRPLQVDVGLLEQLTEEDLGPTIRRLVEQLGCSHTTVESHL